MTTSKKNQSSGFCSPVRNDPDVGVLDYRILGIQVKQPPGLVHEIRKVVENPEARAEDSGAAVFQSVVLRWN